MVDTELTVSQPLQVRVRLAGLDFNGVLQALEQERDSDRRRCGPQRRAR